MSRIDWACWDGGPHILIPEAALPLWEGSCPPSNGRLIQVRRRFDPTGPATDFDRACEIEDLLGVIRVGGHDAIVIGDEVPMSTLARFANDSLAVFVPMTWSEPGAFGTAEAIAAAIREAGGRFASTGLPMTHPGGRVVLQAAVDGAGVPLGGRVVAELPSGSYTLMTFDGDVTGGEVRVHALLPTTK
jgi:hypothetical protein